MNIATLYIDATEEITAVIERLKAAHEPIVALVVPKGAALTQSIVNLKLARKAAQDATKDLILVTSDSIARNLATQIGIPVAANEKEVKQVAAGELAGAEDGTTVVAGVRIHRYYTEESTSNTEEPEVEDLTAETPIVPKTLLNETEAAEPVSAPTEPEAPDIEVIAPAAAEPKPQPATISRRRLEPAVEVSEKPAEPTPAQATTPPPRSKQKKAHRGWAIPVTAALILVLLAGTALSFLYYPKVTVALAVPSTAWEEDLTVVASPAEAARAENHIPYETVTVTGEESISFAATGIRKVGEAAKGTAKIFNSQDSDPQNLPAGARIQANGRVFVTDAAVTVPGVRVQAGQLVPGSATVAITAEDVGAESNMSGTAGNIVSPSTRLYAQIEKTEGGSSRDIKIVTAGDIQKAKEQLLSTLRTNLTAKLSSELDSRTFFGLTEDPVFAETSFTTTKAAGDEAENAEAVLAGTLGRVIITEEAISQAHFDASGFSPDKFRFIVQEVSVSSVTPLDGGLYAVETTAKGLTISNVDTKALTQELAGKSLDEALRITESSSLEATITFRPSWWPVKRLPTMSSSIDVLIHE